MNGTEFSEKYMCGVPEGSVLGLALVSSPVVDISKPINQRVSNAIYVYDNATEEIAS